MSDFGINLVNLAIKLAPVVKRVGVGKAMARHVRNHVMRGTVRMMHEDFAHKVRLWISEASSKGLGNEKWYLQQDAARSAAKSVEKFLELDEDIVYCSIKIIQPRDDGVLITKNIARSNQDRDDVDHEILRPNSAFKTLIKGGKDETERRTPFRFFSCPDLFSHVASFACSRNNWQKHYRSAVILPLKHFDNDGKAKPFGFLTFDSPRINAFGIPDCFSVDWRTSDEGPQRFWGESSAISVTHLMALMADVLAISLVKIVTDDCDVISLPNEPARVNRPKKPSRRGKR
jgi:hypothetical protein